MGRSSVASSFDASACHGEGEGLVATVLAKAYWLVILLAMRF